MVDMTGRKAIDAPLPPPSPVKAKRGRETTDEDRMIGSAAVMVVFGCLFGLAWQFEQWWLVCGAGVALVMLYHLFTMFQERIERPRAAQQPRDPEKGEVG